MNVYNADLYHTVVYLLKARTVAAEKQPLLRNGVYTCTTGTLHVCCDVTQQGKRCCKLDSLWVHAALVATQLCGKSLQQRINKQQ
jgi:hypothetical protein